MSTFALWFALAASAALARASDNLDNVQTELRSAKPVNISTLSRDDGEENRSLLSVRSGAKLGWSEKNERSDKPGCQCKCGGNCNWNAFGYNGCFHFIGMKVNGKKVDDCTALTTKSSCKTTNTWGQEPCDWKDYTCTCANGNPGKGEDANCEKCDSCRTGYYKTGSTCSACKVCGAQWRTKSACTAVSDTVCECDRGYAGADCAACTGNTFADDFGMSACKTCPDGANGLASNGGTANDQCAGSTCQHPAPPEHAMIDAASCPENGIQEQSKCDLKCVDGYKSSDMTPYTCKATTGTVNAAYQDGSITCTASTCQRPAALPEHAMIVEANCPDSGIQGQSTCDLACVPGYKGSQMAAYSCETVTDSADAAYKYGAITCTELPPCNVTLYMHWAAETNPDYTGEMKNLTGTGTFPLNSFNHTSAVNVVGEGCVAYGYTNGDCSGDKGNGISEGVMGPTALPLWGCTDCLKCVRIEREVVWASSE